MEARELAAPAKSQRDEKLNGETLFRSATDARRLLAPFIADERELERAAKDFFMLAGRIAGRESTAQERGEVARAFLDRIAREATDDLSPDEKRAAVRRALDEMRDENVRLRSSPEARRAHLEIEGAQSVRDDLRALYEPSDGRTRAEHASRLNDISQDARDAFERGATLFGDVFAIPRDPTGKADRTDQIRTGSHAHAVREFTPLVGEARAKQLAAEFVELGKQIAGRTADGDTRLVTFRAFYREIKRDESGKLLSRAEQTARLEPVLERMRVMARAMRAEEWKRDPAEFVEIDEWEREISARERDAEYESHGRRTFSIEAIAGLELDEHDAARDDSRREQDSPDREREGLGSVSKIEYERVRLSELPPRLPDDLSNEDERHLRREIIPRLDRQIEAGASAPVIFAGLAATERAEEARSRDAEIVRTFQARAPEEDIECPLSRDEDLRALYTLDALLAHGEAVARGRSGKEIIGARYYETSADEYEKHRAIVRDEIERLAPSPRERAEALTSVGERGAQDFRHITKALRAFEAAEAESERLREEAGRFETEARESQVFQTTLAAVRRDERDATRAALEVLTQGSVFTDEEKTKDDRERGVSNYPELTGDARPLSPYAELRADGERTRAQARAELIAGLSDPHLELLQEERAVEIARHQRFFSHVAGREIETSAEAREALAPQLEKMRAALYRLRDERQTIGVEQEKGRERAKGAIHIALGIDSRTRFALGSLNEYRTVTSLAARLELPVRVYSSLHGREITGENSSRAGLYAFARDYVGYRLQDDATRLQNERPLYREYRVRLDRARSAEELRATIKEIRHDNYDRFAHPAHYAEEARELLARGERTRRPLSEIEMSKLLLSDAPAHYTPEMRALRRERAATSREKQERINRLERGEVAPSPALTRLLQEFARTAHKDPARYARNVRSFLGDYLNPPSPERNRFSPENLYELGKGLNATERNYFFRLVDETKRALAAGTPVKEIKLHTLFESNVQRVDEHTHSHMLLDAPAKVMQLREESAAFRRYYGASLWREAELTSDILHRSLDAKEHPAASQETARGISQRDLNTVASLLDGYRHQPHLIKMTSSYLRESDDVSKRRLGEIVETFRQMRPTRDDKNNLRFQIAAPARSELSRREWERLLDHFTARALSQPDRQHMLTGTQRREVRRTAQASAWREITTNFQVSIPNPVGESLREPTSEIERAIETSATLQERARTASEAREAFIAEQVSKVARATVSRDGLRETQPREIEKLTLHALDPARSSQYLQALEARDDLTAEDKQRAQDKLETVSRIIEPRARETYRQLDEYAARMKSEYLASFRRIDEAAEALQREERRAKFAPLRGEMEARVAAYLTKEMRAEGASVFSCEGAHHTESIQRIITEAFQERGIKLADFNLNDERVRAVASRLVSGLPRALGQNRALELRHSHDHTLNDIARRDHALPAHSAERFASPSRTAQHPMIYSAEHVIQPDEAALVNGERIEQRVVHSFNKLQERVVEHSTAHDQRTSSSSPLIDKQTAHEPNGDNHQVRERTLVLVR